MQPRRRRSFEVTLAFLWLAWGGALVGGIYLFSYIADGLVGVAVYCGLFLGGICWYYVGRRLWQASGALRSRRGITGAENIVLLLRPFEVDVNLKDKRRPPSKAGPEGSLANEALNVVYSNRFRRAPLPSIENAQSFEDSLSNSVGAALGTLVSVGNPADRLPSSGAKKVYASDSDWQQVVSQTMVDAKCILLFPGDSPGLIWELRHLKAHIDGAKVFVVTLPYKIGKDSLDWPAQHLVFLDAGWQLPEDNPGYGAILAFNHDWTPCLCARGLESANEITYAVKQRLVNGSFLHPSVRSHSGSMIVCPKCSVKVMPTKTGECPSCRKPIVGLSYEDTLIKETPRRELTAYEEWQMALRHLALKRIGVSGALLVLTTLAIVLVPGVYMYFTDSFGLLDGFDTKQRRLLVTPLVVVVIVFSLGYFVLASPIFFLLHRLEQNVTTRLFRPRNPKRSHLTKP